MEMLAQVKEMVYSLAECEKSIETQITLVVLLSSVMIFYIPWIAQKVAKPYLDEHPAKEQIIFFTQQTMRTSFSIDLDKAAAFEFTCILVGILSQHFIGGLLCIPSVFGFPLVPVNTASALARFGALSEVAWEIQDAYSRSRELLYGGEAGKRNNPPSLLFLGLMHHLPGFSMVIPMNIYYGDNKIYHELVLMLQFAAACALFVQLYGYTLNVKTADGLMKMKMCVLFAWTVITYSRIFQFSYLGRSLLSYIHTNGDYGIFWVGSFVLGTMFLFNILLLLDATKKLIKFFPMKLSESNVKEVQVQGIRTANSF